ncbi:MAG: hypothetical protein AABX82_08245 [Nanoarchaeota archaeon]
MVYAALVPYLSIISCIPSPNVDTLSATHGGTLEQTVSSPSSAQAPIQLSTSPSTLTLTSAAPDPTYHAKALDLAVDILNNNCRENEPLVSLPYSGCRSPSTVYKSFSVYENGILTTALAEGEKSSGTIPSSLYFMLCSVPCTLPELSLENCNDQIVEIYDYDLDGIPDAGIIPSGLLSFSYGYLVYSRASNDSFDYQRLYHVLLDTFTSSCKDTSPQLDMASSQQ